MSIMWTYLVLCLDSLGLLSHKKNYFFLLLADVKDIIPNSKSVSVMTKSTFLVLQPK